MGATASDVAKKAGVSVSTVSRALISPDKVAPVTRQRILEVAQSLHYRPSRAARDLATGRTDTIALVIPDLENPYFSSLTKAIQARARELGYQLFVIDTDEDPGRELETLGKLSRDVDGVVLCSPRASDDDLLARSPGIRLVTLNRTIPGVASVLSDDGDGMAQALRHLVALGHRRIAYAGGPLSSWSDRVRRTSFMEHGSAEASVELHDLGSFMPYFSGGVAAADLLLATPATAVVAFNDLVALGLLDRIRGRGVHAPDQISIVSFDNTMFASAATPHLTSVDFPRRLVARHTLDMLLSDEQGSSAPPRQVLPTQLNVRASSGPAPAPPSIPR